MAISGTVHHYAPKQVAFEFNSSTTHVAKNVVLFIAGLTDGLLTVHYLPQLAEKVSSLEGDWVLVQGVLSSAYTGWGQSSLQKDNEEIGKIVSYLRSEEGGSRNKVVLMGHSTGCQDTLRYMSIYSAQEGFEKSKKVDGGILQAPVSDREGVAQETGDPEGLDKCVQECYDDYISKGLGRQMLPLKFTRFSLGCQINAYRFYSLYSKYGDDDFFSTYLTDEDLAKTFGKVEKPLLVLYGDKDEYGLEGVDLDGLIGKWAKACKPGVWSKQSKVLKGANHTVDDSEACSDLLETVGRFVGSL